MVNALKVVIVLALAFGGIGFLLPPERGIVHEIEIAGGPPAIQRVITDMETWPEWSAWTQERDPVSAMAFSDPSHGHGAWLSWTEGEKQGAGRWLVTSVTDQEAVGLVMAQDGLGESPGTFGFSPIEDGTLVTWTQTLVLGASPIKRWVGMLAAKPLGEDMRTGLVGLRERFQSR